MLSQSQVSHLNNGTNSSKGEWKEHLIQVPWGHVAGKWWGDLNQQPILCIHGWQDNAGTFDNLIPLLPKNLSFLAIDLPGHGLSSHYPRGLHYYLFWDGISLIRRIVKQNKWTNIKLMGHSLGGALCFMYAASFPEEVHSFISLDILGPTIRDVDNTASRLGASIDKFLKYETIPESSLPFYDYDESLKLVLDAYEGSITMESCKVLMKRGMAHSQNQDKDGYHFARDLRLKVSLMGMLSIEQVLAFASKIVCKVLCIRGVPGMKFDKPEYFQSVVEKTRESSERFEYHEIQGTHHLHLNTPEMISEIITEFIMS
ncbi:probable serine hydrolase [Ctenocephalides felis]|uniref:probable serine hydrolase n=1 Tax=Ctenocephalides felis TaxID=7515 RepID=UPI000E6E38D8|nr:probable serine hydrolase [Ctenocephalides felis]XP_026462394.1 probable serine hydrolase [Ctenocephalides felis]